MMKQSKEYPGFMEVDAKFKIGDIVDYYKIESISIGQKVCNVSTCVITKICTLADGEYWFEPSYDITELINGRMVKHSILGGVYESELKLNIKVTREMKLKDIIDNE